MSFFSLKHGPTFSFVCDLRDMSVTVAAVRFVSGIKPELVLCQTTPIAVSRDDSDNHDAYLDSLMNALDICIVDLRKKLIKIGHTESINRIYFFFGSPWVISQSKLVKIIRERPFEINNTFLSRIISREESFLLHHIGQNMSSDGTSVFEEKVVFAKLDGYPVENIFGKKVRDFEAELFVSFMPTLLMQRVGGLLREESNHNGILHASLLSLYTFLRESLLNKDDALYIDIGDMITDVCIVHNGVISGIISFPFGRKRIITEAVQTSNLSESILLSHLSLAHEGNVVSEDGKINQAIETATTSWVTEFIATLSQGITSVSAPRDAIFVRHDAFDDILIATLIRQQISLFNIHLRIATIDEHVIDADITNAKTFPNQPLVKMDILFLERLTHGE